MSYAEPPAMTAITIGGSARVKRVVLNVDPKGASAQLAGAPREEPQLLLLRDRADREPPWDWQLWTHTILDIVATISEAPTLIPPPV